MPNSDEEEPYDFLEIRDGRIRVSSIISVEMLPAPFNTTGMLYEDLVRMNLNLIPIKIRDITGKEYILAEVQDDKAKQIVAKLMDRISNRTLALDDLLEID